MQLEYEFIETWEELHEIIQLCEGRHTQQVVVSTFHDGLTQIDWTDKKIRSTIKRDSALNSNTSKKEKKK